MQSNQSTELNPILLQLMNDNLAMVLDLNEIFAFVLIL